MTTKSTRKFKIFNISAFDPIRFTWVIDRFLNNQDLAIAQAENLKATNPKYWVYVRAHKSRRDYDGEIIWESDPIKDEG